MGTLTLFNIPAHGQPNVPLRLLKLVGQTQADTTYVFTNKIFLPPWARGMMVLIDIDKTAGAGAVSLNITLALDRPSDYVNTDLLGFCSISPPTQLTDTFLLVYFHPDLIDQSSGLVSNGEPTRISLPREFRLGVQSTGADWVASLLLDAFFLP